MYKPIKQCITTLNTYVKKNKIFFFMILIAVIISIGLILHKNFENNEFKFYNENNELSLVELNNDKTDKNTAHSYLPLYDNLLKPIKDTATNILEVGIGDFQTKNGGSLLLWTNYFTNATIYGIDILPLDRVLDEVINDPSIRLYCSSDAYNKDFISKNLSNIKFDFLLDDGPHTLKSQEQFIELYSPLLSENGILIIEDVQDINWLENFKNKTPEHLKQYIKTYDLRKNNGRYDDIVFTIDRVVR